MFRILRNMKRLPLGAKHAAIALLILLIILICGTVGFMLIEDMSFNEALYMTVITISTVGFREVRDLGTGGTYFTIAIIFTGVSTVLFFLTGVFEFILGEYFGEFWRQRKMKANVTKLRNHFVVCGFGRVGRSVADELARQNEPFVIVEKDREVFYQCQEQGYLAVQGNATDSEVLKEAGIQRAAGLVTALNSDSENLYTVLTAKVLNPGIIIVARADQPDSEEKLEMVGADRVISPYKIAGKRMANLLTRPQACEFLDAVTSGNLPEYQLSEVLVTDDFPYLGMTIRGTRLRERTGVTILSMRKKGETAFNINPTPEILIEEGDVLILIGTPDQMESLGLGRSA